MKRAVTRPWSRSGRPWVTANAASWARRGRIWCSGSAIQRPGWCLSARDRVRTRTKRVSHLSAMPAGCSIASSRPWVSSARMSTSATWSSAALPETATPSRTRSGPVHHSCCAKSRQSNRKSSCRSANSPHRHCWRQRSRSRSCAAGSATSTASRSCRPIIRPTCCVPEANSESVLVVWEVIPPVLQLLRLPVPDKSRKK